MTSNATFQTSMSYQSTYEDKDVSLLLIKPVPPSYFTEFTLRQRSVKSTLVTLRTVLQNSRSKVTALSDSFVLNYFAQLYIYCIIICIQLFICFSIPCQPSLNTAFSSAANQRSRFDIKIYNYIKNNAKIQMLSTCRSSIAGPSVITLTGDHCIVTQLVVVYTPLQVCVQK